MWNGKIKRKLSENGYDLNNSFACYVIVAGSYKMMSGEMIDEVFKITRAGFSVSEVLDLISSALKSNIVKAEKEIYAGFVWDKSLDERLRVSIWLFTKASRHLNAV